MITYANMHPHLLSRIQVSDDPNECWPWKLVPNPQGYGHSPLLKPLFGTRKAHRAVYLSMVDSTIPTTQRVHHTCENPRCCNPNHLTTVRQRSQRDQEIIKLYRKGSLQKDLAKSFGLSPARIGQIIASYGTE